MNRASIGTQGGRPPGWVTRSRLSRTVTSHPRRNKASTMCDPIWPAPPVTSALILVVPPLFFWTASPGAISRHERAGPPLAPGTPATIGLGPRRARFPAANPDRSRDRNTLLEGDRGWDSGL